MHAGKALAAPRHKHFSLSLDLHLHTPGPGLTEGGSRLLSGQKSLEALMAVLEGGKGPKVKYTKKHVATPPSQAPSSRAASPSHCLRALPRPDPLPGAPLPPSTETGGLGP